MAFLVGARGELPQDEFTVNGRRGKAMFKKIDVVVSYIRYFFLSRYGYIFVGVVFVVWMTFFDTHSFIKSWRLRSENIRLKRENTATQHSIDENERLIKALTDDREMLERYAREKYGMKASDEDVFLFDE
jgi:putative septum formation initiator-related protein